MPIEHKLVKAEPSSPTRCQGPGDNGEGQCVFESVPGHDRCPKHGGHLAAKRDERKRVHDYRLQVWQERVDEFAESDKHKSLRGEVGVLRLMIETIVTQCKDQPTLVLYSGKIADLISRAERLMLSCDKLETRMGMFLDKSSALIIAGQIVEVIGRHVKDPAAIDDISNGIIDILCSIGNTTPGEIIDSDPSSGFLS